jgi:hypothetical protein
MQRILFDVGQHHPHVGRRQSASNGEADSTGCAGYERCFPLEVTNHLVLPLFNANPRTMT